MNKPTQRVDVDSHRGLPEWLLLHQAYAATFKALELTLLPLGLTMPRLHLMGILASAEGPLTLSELAEAMVREPHSLVRITDELEALGWVKRSADPSDRRRKPIALTRKGRAAFEKAFPLAVAAGKELVSSLGDQELAQLGKYLGIIRDDAMEELEKAAASSGAAP
jgi:DNA-binding MarR family transcriptional regulator